VHAAAADGHGLAAPRHGRQVLDDGAVDGVLEAGLRGRATAGFADERFQDRVLGPVVSKGGDGIEGVGEAAWVGGKGVVVLRWGARTIIVEFQSATRVWL